jgi:hypothetical protein
MRFAALACGLLLAAACSEVPTDPVAPPMSAAVGRNAFVTTTADEGEGSLRAALQEAGADNSIKHIKVKAGGTIVLSTPLVWSGTQALSIDGAGAVIDASGLAEGESGLIADGGGDLEVSDLTVDGAPSSGIFVDVPDLGARVQRVTFKGVTVRNSGLHGVVVNDQVDPAGTSPAGSDASLVVSVSNSLFEGNGKDEVDFDGFRINEGGNGSIFADVARTTFRDNGADGLELDERGPGDAAFSLAHTSLVDNGFLSTDDPDDGIDVDEAGDGDIVARFNNVESSNNSEQGVDLNENDAGHLRVTMNKVTASGNGGEGIEFEEDDDVAGGGDLIADLSNITTNGNGKPEIDEADAGLKLREKGEGDLLATIVQATSNQNQNGPSDGIGGILIREDSDGALTATVKQATANNNETSGLRIRGNGTALVQQLSATGNPDGNLLNDAGVVVTQIP